MAGMGTWLAACHQSICSKHFNQSIKKQNRTQNGKYNKGCVGVWQMGAMGKCENAKNTKMGKWENENPELC